MAMNALLRNRWVDALRSGKYSQTRGMLFVPGEGSPSYCCLGVLCAIQPTEFEASIENEVAGFRFVRTQEKVVGSLYVDKDVPDSHHIVREMGLTDDEHELLMSYNDGNRTKWNPEGIHYSFDQIANYIEEYL